MHDRNQLTQEYVQILLSLMVEVFANKGSDGLPIWLWNLGISRNGNFPKVARTFEALQGRHHTIVILKWDTDILLSFLNWVKFFFREIRVSHWGNGYNQSIAVET